MAFRIFLASLALLTAPCWAIYAQAASGGFLPEWAEPINGFRLADSALMEVRRTSNDENTSFKVSKSTADKARSAYVAEPFATNSLFIEALAVQDSRAEILSASRRIDKRNQLVGLSLLELEADRNAMKQVLSLVDELARVRPKLAPEFVSVLSASLTHESSESLLEQALASNPTWATAFWRRVPEETAALSRFLRLREKISPPADLASERSLLQALVNSKRFAEAFDLYGVLSQREATQGAYPPIDWQLTRARDAQARQLSTGAYELFMERNTSGKFAERLVSLSAGEFALSGRIDTRQGDVSVHAELRCAEEAVHQGWMPRASFPNANWMIPSDSCRFAWLTLSGSTWDSSQPFKGRVSGLVFEKK